MFNLTGFAVFALSASITPGPNNMLLTALGASGGIRRGLPALFGIAFGFAVMIFLIVIGLGETIVQAGSATTIVMRIVGIAILTWMAWQIATAPVTETGKADAPDAALAKKTGTFFGMAAFQWVNPKAWVMVVGAVTTYVPREAFAHNVSVIALLLGVVNAPSVSLWAGFGVALRRLLDGPRRLRAFNLTMAALLVLSLYPVLWR